MRIPSITVCLVRMLPGRAAGLAAMVVCLALLAGMARSEEISGQDVRRAMQGGVKFLKGMQGVNGEWTYGQYSSGLTALVGLALLNCDVPPDDPVITRAVQYVLDSKNQQTYCVALKAMFLAQVDPKKHLKEIQRAADWLIQGQSEAGTWTYGNNANANPNLARIAAQMYDNSNTQFAVLGLYAADQAGAKVPDEVWKRVATHFAGTMTKDNGWGYHGNQGASPSMTCAGVASLYMAGLQLLSPTDKCGTYEVDSRIMLGLNWLGAHFNVRGGNSSMFLYQMYALERVGVIAARKNIGTHDWYREGAEMLVRSQDKEDGCWGVMARGRNVVTQEGVTCTAFALLFLGKGRAPVMVNKLMYPGEKTADAWDLHPYDARNLCANCSTLFKDPVSWQEISLNDSLEEFVRAPVLYLNGHEAFTLSDEQRQKLFDFIEQGGTIVSVACCSTKDKPTGFDTSCRKLYKAMFPDRDLEAVDKGHSVYTAFYDLQPRQTLSGLNFGCRTAVFHCTDRMACSWQGEKTKTADDDMKLGVNIAAYATGMEPLRDKLDQVKLTKRAKGPSDSELLRGALVLGQVSYEGRWDNDNMALTNLMEHLRTHAGMDVSTQRKVVKLDSPELFSYPIIYLTGSRGFSFDDAAVTKLRTYLDRGGFLFADATTGSPAFVKSFRELAAKLYSDTPLKAVDVNHELYNSGVKLRKVAYKPRVLKEHPGLDEPTVEVIEHEGRVKVAFSPYDIGCALAGFKGDALGYTVDSAMDVATAVILYAMNH